MSAKLIDGKELANQIKYKIKDEIVKNAYTPNLAIILVGNDKASKLYVKLKEKACHEVGIEFHKYFLAENSTQEQLNELIDFLNNDDTIDAILIQLPLPSQLDEKSSVERIKKEKEVDGFSEGNLNDFINNKAKIIPGLANGIYELIKATEENIENTNSLVIANSEIFAKPIIKMMTNKKSNCEYIHPSNNDLINKTKNSDIIIIAVGKKWFLNKEMIKKDSIIIDVGINSENGKTFGDVDPNVDEIASFRSPVPGGVGPMTIAMLLLNTLELYKLKNK